MFVQASFSLATEGCGLVVKTEAAGTLGVRFNSFLHNILLPFVAPMNNPPSKKKVNGWCLNCQNLKTITPERFD